MLAGVNANQSRDKAVSNQKVTKHIHPYLGQLKHVSFISEITHGITLQRYKLGERYKG